MKIVRSSKCSLKHLTNAKKQQLEEIMKEYSKIVNFFINHLWNKKIAKKDLKKEIFNLPETWLSGRLKQTAARETIDMIKSTNEVFESNKESILLNIAAMENKIKEIKNHRPDSKINRRKVDNLHCKIKRNTMKCEMIRPQKPKHKGKRMCISALVADLHPSKSANNFNAWLHLSSIGNKISMNLPIKFHKHFREMNSKGNRLNSYIITKDYVQFCFEIETGPKRKVEHLVGVDTGINALASTSDGKQFGREIKDIIAKIKRCKWGSKKQKRLRKTLQYKICETAKKVAREADLVVVEKLKNLTKNIKLKGRLSKNVRSSIGNWNYSFWLRRLEMCCEDHRVAFRTVSPYKTSQTCSKCGYADGINRNGEEFKCRTCNHTGNADINAALNILMRFVTGKYGSCYKTLIENVV